MKLKCSLDLDSTVFEWNNHYNSRCGIPKTDYEITRNVKTILLKDKDFWLTQPLLNVPNFNVYSYCTARIIPKNWIKEQIIMNNLPKAPIYQVKGVSLSKVPQLKRSGCDVHIDDSLSVFIKSNLAGIPCLLIDSPNNQSWDEPIGRIYSLDKDEIEEVYHLFKKTIFPYFKELIK